MSNLLKSCLFGLDTGNEPDPKYCQGLIVGLVSTKIDEGYGFDESINEIAINLPDNISEDCLPEAWRDMIMSRYRLSHPLRIECMCFYESLVIPGTEINIVSKGEIIDPSSECGKEVMRKLGVFYDEEKWHESAVWGTWTEGV